MPQADSQNTTSASIATKVANGLFELNRRFYASAILPTPPA